MLVSNKEKKGSLNRLQLFLFTLNNNYITQQQEFLFGSLS